MKEVCDLPSIKKRQHRIRAGCIGLIIVSVVLLLFVFSVMSIDCAGKTIHSLFQTNNADTNIADTVTMISIESAYTIAAPTDSGLGFVQTDSFLIVFKNGQRIAAHPMARRTIVYQETDRLALNSGESLAVITRCVLTGIDDTNISVGMSGDNTEVYSQVYGYAPSGDSWSKLIKGLLAVYFHPDTSISIVLAVPNNKPVCYLIDSKGVVLVQREFDSDVVNCINVPGRMNLLMLQGFSACQFVNYDLSDYWSVAGDYRAMPEFSASGRYVGIGMMDLNKVAILDVENKKMIQLQGIYITSIDDNRNAIIGYWGGQPGMMPIKVRNMHFRFE